MKKRYYLLIVLFIVGILFINNNHTTIGVDKKVVNEENSEEYGPLGSVSFNQAIVKRGINNEFLYGVKFKMSTYNNIYSSNSQLDDDIYYFDSNYEGEGIFEKAYNILSQEQKSAVETIKTTKDLKKISNGKYIYCESYDEYWDMPMEPNNAQMRRQTGYYCYVPLPTVYYLEETNVPSGYVKDKVIVPGDLALTYFVEGFEPPVNVFVNNQVGIIDNIPTVDMIFGNNTYNVKLVGINVHSMDYGVHIKYGDANINDLVGLDIDKSMNIWEEKGLEGTICTKELNDLVEPKSTSDQFLASIEFAEDFYDGPCGAIVLVNQKGNVNLNISSYVNGESAVKVANNTKVQYRVVVNNTGSVDAIDNKIVAKLPAGLTYVEGSATNGGVYKDGTIEWDIARIKEGEKLNLAYEAIVPKNASSLKDYIGEASIETFGVDKRIESNKTKIKVNLTNPQTGNQIIIIGLIITILTGLGVYLYLYKQQRKSN